MNLQEALTILVEETRERSDDPKIRAARKRVEKRIEALRLKKERMAQKLNSEE